MAKMCFGAYASRLHEAALPAHTEDVAEDFRQDLLDLFTHAHTKRTFKQSTAARHMIPRLTGNPPWTRAEKISLVKDFVAHYSGVREDLEAIDELYNSDRPVNHDFITAMRNRVVGLHSSLAGGTKWRGIMPYTPLPMECLTWLSWSIAGRKPYQLLGDLISHVEDVKNWLVIPPLNMELYPDVRVSMKERLKKEIETVTKAKAEKADIGPSPENHADTKAVARLQEKIAEQLRRQKEQEKDIERRERDMRVEANRLRLQNEKLQEQEKLSQEAIQRVDARVEEAKHRIKVLEDAAAKQSAEESKRQQKDAATATEREDAYKQQMALNAKEIADLQVALSAAKAQIAIHEAQTTIDPPNQSRALDQPVESSLSSNSTARSSILQPQSTFGTSLSNSIVTNLNGFHHPFINFSNSHDPEPVDLPLPMEDIRQTPLETENSTQFAQNYFPRPGLYDPAQPLQFAPSNGNNFSLQQHQPAADEIFKEACPAWKAGRCPHGKTCKRKHEPCRKWMKGLCKFGARCYNSHDPFFKSFDPMPPQFQQSDLMSIDFSPPSPPNPWAPVSLPNFDDKQLSTPLERRILVENVPAVSPIRYDSNTISSHAPFPTPIVPFSLNHPQELAMQGQIDPTNDHQRFTVPSQKRLEEAKEGENSHFKHDHLYAQVRPGSTPKPPNKLNPRKKEACKNYQRGKCNKNDEECTYAHKPCPMFIKDSCIYPAHICLNSHDPIFLTQRKSSNALPKASHAPNPFSAFPPPSIQNNAPPKPSSMQQQWQPPTHPTSDMERGLNELLSFAASTSRTTTRIPNSELPCKHQQKPYGCTNPACPFKHDVQVFSEPSKGTHYVSVVSEPSKPKHNPNDDLVEEML